MIRPLYDLQLNSRFDIVLKTVYAFYWIENNGSVPRFVYEPTQMLALQS